MSIHDRYELAFPSSVVGMRLMILTRLLTSFDSSVENVFIESIIVAKLGFGDIERPSLDLALTL